MTQSLIRCLDDHAARHPDAPLFTFHDARGIAIEQYGYGEFAQRSAALAQALRERGMRHGDRALLLHPPGLELIVALYACARIGVIATVAPVGSASAWRGAALADRIARIVADCTPAIALLTAAQAAMGIAPFAVPLLPTDAAPFRPNGTWPDDPHPIMLLQYTSGSASAPRGVAVSHANVIANARALIDHAPIGVSWLPQFHDMGLIGYYLFPVVLGGRSHGMSPADFLRRPGLWLRMIANVRATFSSGPDFGFAYCLEPGRIAPQDLDGVDLSSLRVLLNGAEPVKPETCRAFVRRFAPYGLKPDALVAAYGLAEATLAVTGGSARATRFDADALAAAAVRPPGTTARAVELASCGVPLPNLRLEIRAPGGGAPMAPDTVGEIWVSGPSITAGYWNGDAPPDGPAPLRTGDLGFLHDGELYVCGRLSDLIIRHGCNHHPHDIEAAANDPALRVRGMVAFQESDGAVVLLVETAAHGRLPDPKRLARRVARATGLALDRVVIAPPRSIARTTSGKLARRETARRLADGAIRPLLDQALDGDSTDDRGDALAWLADTVAQQPELNGLAVAEAGLDSLQLVQLQLALQDGLLALGDPAAAALVDGPALQHWRCGEVLALAEALEAGDQALARSRAGALATLGSHAKADEQARIAADTRLPLPALPRHDVSAPPPDRALLTGATGFFGPFLLASLLAQTRLPVHVVARGASDAEARARVIAALHRARLYDEAQARGLEERLTVWQGDLAAPALGLASVRWEALAAGHAAIYHNGAAVDYVRTYAALRPANVEGTRTMLALAMTGAPKTFHHVSSTFIFGWTRQGVLPESDDNGAMDALDFGYSQSKWAAEQLVRRASAAGLPVAIYRPSLISVSGTMRGDAHDVAARLLAFMIRHGVAVDTPNQISLLPADVLAHNLIAISRTPLASGETYHLTADRYHSMTALTRQITRDFGYPFAYSGISAFIARLNALATPDDPVFPLLDFFNRSAPHIEAMRLKRYDNRVYRAARASLTTALPDPPLAEIARRLVFFLADQGWIASPGTDAAKATRYAANASTPPASASAI